MFGRAVLAAGVVAHQGLRAASSKPTLKWRGPKSSKSANKAKENFDRDRLEAFKAASEQYTKEIADTFRNYDRETVEAAIK